MSFGLVLVFVFRIFFLSALLCLHSLRATQIGRLLSLKFAACGAAVSVCLWSVCRRDILIIHFDFFAAKQRVAKREKKWVLAGEGVGTACQSVWFWGRSLTELALALLVIYKHARHFR